MASSRTDIANQALSVLGEAGISSFDANTPAAISVKLHYDTVRESLLRKHPWNFATGRVELTALAATPDFGWAYQYQLPSDWLRLITLNGTEAKLAESLYNVEGEVLLTDASTAKITYVKKITDTTLFDALFTDVLVLSLAAKIAIDVTSSKTKRDEMVAAAEALLGDARFVDANEAETRVLSPLTGSAGIGARGAYGLIDSLSSREAYGPSVDDLVAKAGADGSDGWTPIWAIVDDSGRNVVRITGWSGGTGTEPDTGYLSASGLVATAAGGIDISGDTGATGATGAAGSNGTNGTNGTNGATGPTGPSSGVLWSFASSTTSADPAEGNFRLNHALMASATEIYIDDLETIGGADMSAWMATWDDSTAATNKGVLTIHDITDNAIGTFTVTAIADNTGWFTVTVVYISGTGGTTEFGSTNDCWFGFSRTGDTGASGAGTGDVVGPASSTNSSFAEYDGTSGTLLKDGSSSASDFATAAQGTTADSATQPGDNISTLTNDSGFTDDQTGAEIKSAYEGEADTNAFTDSEKTLLGNQSGVNTGDQTSVSGNAGTVTTNANLTGHITSTGNAAILGSFTVSQLSTALSDASISGSNTGDEAAASATVSGISELATIAEINTGTDTARTITPAGLAGADKKTEIGIALGDETTAITTGTAKVTFRMPYAMTLTDIRLSAVTAPTGSTLTVDVNETASTILSTKLTIDATEKTSETAATPAVISDSALAADAEITVDFDTVGSTIAGAGLKLWLIGTRI